MSELDTLTGDNSTLYTPSTRRVRALYIHRSGGSTWYEGKAEALGESFDRWLDEVKAQVWDEAERRGRDNERALMMCQAQLRPSSSAVLIKNPYRQGEEQ